ncbi:MAG TPA: 4Fe-4S binding protein [Clostridia bacterium]|nr:4Fe-4S binding protein [Clostridia bacterium]
MKKNYLGKTGIKVTELCFGVLPMGPLQAKVPLLEGARLLRLAAEEGVNFFDTAEMYQTYDYLKQGLEGFSGEVVIATKSTASTYKDMEKSIENFLRALGRDYLDIFLLHAAKATPAVFSERAGAFDCLMDYKNKGFLRAIGISTHSAGVVHKAAEVKEIDIVFPIINKIGMGIIDGTAGDMLTAIDRAFGAGKGLYAMKVLAGGHLIGEIQEAFSFVRGIPGINSVAVGMIKKEELDLNLKIFRDLDVSGEIQSLKTKFGKRLFISPFCQGCGTCIEVCPNGALSIKDGKAVCDHHRCLLCGYCNPICPEFALRLL